MSKIKEFEQGVKESGNAGSFLLNKIGKGVQAAVGYPDIVEWISGQNIKNEKGEDFDLVDHKYMIDILRDYSPLQVWKKAAQIGCTTLAIYKTYHAARYRNWNVIYTLPSADDVRILVNTKVNPIIQANPIMTDWVGKDDMIFLKRIGQANIIYKGTFVEKEGIMVSSDLNIHDEVDRSNLGNLDIFESRLMASKYRGQWFFSNPSYPAVGVDEFWGMSDQKHWIVKCESCNQKQYLSWPDSFHMEKGIYICKKCGKEISTHARINGDWVSKYENKDYSGYWISHMMAPYVGAADVIRAYKTKDRATFYNFFLGLEYAGSDINVGRKTLIDCIKEESPGQNFVMGIDQGLHEKHVVLGTPKGITKLIVAKTWEDIRELIERYNPKMVVIDAQPNTDEVLKLQKLFPFKVYMCYYKPDPKDPTAIIYDDTICKVNAPRDRSLDETVRMFTSQSWGLLAGVEHSPEFERFVKHWEGMFLTVVEDNHGNKRRVWRGSRNDHFPHASNYFRMAVEKVKEFDKSPAVAPRNYARVPDGAPWFAHKQTDDWYDKL